MAAAGRPGAPVARLDEDGVDRRDARVPRQRAAGPSGGGTAVWARPLVTVWQILDRPLDLVGVGVGVLFFCLSLTPSLLPRSWLMQGLISAILAATGYLAGVGLARLGHRLVGWRPIDRIGAGPRWLARLCLYAVAVLAVLVSLYQGAMWQRQIYALMDLPTPTEFGYAGVPVLAAAIFAGLLALARLLHAGARALGRLLGRWIPPAVARVAAALGVAVMFLTLMQGVLANGLMAAANSAFGSINSQTLDGARAPTSPLLSGSPQSLVSWDSLGRWGRDFIAGRPGVADLSRFTGRPAMQPVRVYVGVASAPSTHDEAVLAVRELERTGAFDRAVLCVVTTTGTGWVDRRSLAPLEYMYNGDTATVALQYSYLPSAISFLTDRDRARVAGRELFTQVYDRWSGIPVAHRPKLLIFGESLGAFGAESAFSGLDDLRNRVDGALFIGPPNSSELWREFESGRDKGTTETLPIYQRGDAVRFAGQPSDLSVPGAVWSTPRIVYLQHASDPVVWWSPRLMLHRPEWLAEKRGRDVIPAMRWYPFVTFWQLSADLAFAGRTPSGHGHLYDGEAVDAWASIVAPQGWTAQQTAALRALVRRG